MEMDVREEPQVESCAPRQELRREVERDPVGIGPQQVRQTDVAAGDQRERGEEVLAELPICHPRLALDIRLERERIDHHGAGVAELDVVRRGVLQGPSGLERLELDVERQEGRVLELPERPLIRIGDELDWVGADDRLRGRGGRLGEVDGLVTDETTGGDQPLGEAAGDESVPLVDRRRADLAVQDAVAAVDESAGVSIRTGVADDRGIERCRDGVSWRRRGHRRSVRSPCHRGPHG
jgi:hypothetical protein